MRAILITACLLCAPSLAHAWDGPALWYADANGMPPGGGGILGTGGAHDYNIKCASCHMDPPASGAIDLDFTFTPALLTGGPAPAYLPGQTYQVRVDLVGESLGLSGCGPYANNINEIAVTFEDAAGNTVGTLASDSGQTQSSCPYGYTMPTGGTTALYRDCEVVVSKAGAGATSWTFSWTAPAADTGPVTVYWGAVDGNCDMMSMGDLTKNGTLMLLAGSAGSAPPRVPAPPWWLALPFALSATGLATLRRFRSDPLRQS